MDGAAATQPTVTQLYRRHRGQALAVAKRILGDTDEAEDVVQEVFIRLCLSPGAFDGRAAYTTWLHRVMVNSSINTLRSARRRARLRTDGDAPLTPEQYAIGNEMKRIFQGALAEVSERHQQVLWLREMRGLSYPEIAHLLNIPEGTVKSALNRGRAQVHEILAKRGQYEATGESD
jgi:RNA polymerase sigma-70 factor (ECF subfamily)